MFRSKRPAALSLLALVMACSSDRQTGPSEIATNVRGVAAAKAAASIDTDARAKFTVYAMMSDSITPTGIIGDGRLSDGSPALGAPSEYQGDRCGVTAKIFWYNTKLSHSGDATLDPDANTATCGAARKLGFTIGGTAQMIGPFTNVNQVMQLAVGQSRLQAMTFDATGLANCSRIIFSQVNVTRLSGSTSGLKGTWTVESTNPAGGCYLYSKGAYRYTGTSYALPFHFLITEI